MDNLSWFGYPNDASPSVRSLLLGLQTQVKLCIVCYNAGSPHAAACSWQRKGDM